MVYSIKWQWTKENPTIFETQLDIINSNLMPLLEDETFRENALSFYITRVFFTNVRLNVHAEEENIQELQDTVTGYIEQLLLNPHELDNDTRGWRDEDNGWNGERSESPLSLSGCDRDFHLNYLNDITLIGLDLHRNDTTSAVQKAAEVSCNITPIGILNPRETLDPHFRERSLTYQQKRNSALDDFWGSCGFGYRQGSTEGAHFYYNMVMGIDPRGQALFRNDPDRVLAFVNSNYGNPWPGLENTTQ